MDSMSSEFMKHRVSVMEARKLEAVVQDRQTKPENVGLSAYIVTFVNNGDK